MIGNMLGIVKISNKKQFKLKIPLIVHLLHDTNPLLFYLREPRGNIRFFIMMNLRKKKALHADESKSKELNEWSSEKIW